MADPKRLLSDGATDEISCMERDLLASLEPTATERRQVLGSVLVQAALTTSAATATSVVASQAGASQGVATGSAALGSSPVTTTALVGGATLTSKAGLATLLAVPVIVAGTYFGIKASPESKPAAPAMVQQPAEPVRPRALPSHPTERSEEKKKEEVETQAQKAKPVSTVRPAKASSLVEEDRMLRKARGAFKAGHYEEALATLRGLEARFPDGTLAQEREVLRIAILKKSGAEKQAEERAKDFRDKYPDSPYESPNADSTESNLPK